MVSLQIAELHTGTAGKSDGLYILERFRLAQSREQSWFFTSCAELATFIQTALSSSCKIFSPKLLLNNSFPSSFSLNILISWMRKLLLGFLFKLIFGVRNFCGQRPDSWANQPVSFLWPHKWSLLFCYIRQWVTNACIFVSLSHVEMIQRRVSTIMSSLEFWT